MTGISNNRNKIKHLNLDSFWIRILHQYISYLQPDDVTHRSLYAEQLLRAGILTPRGLCTETLLYTDTFTHRGFYTKREVLHTGALYKDAFAHINKGAEAFLHTEPLPQRSLCTEQFLHTDFLAPKKNRHRENCTHRLHKKNAHHFFCKQKLYPEQFLHSRNSSAPKLLRTDFFKRTAIITDRWFLHRKFSVQKSYAQKALRTTLFYIQTLLYTDAFTRKTNCTQKLVHTAHFYTQTTFTQRGFVSPS